MSPLLAVCPACGEVHSGKGRCRGCRRTYERGRGTPAQRGYGAAWQRLAAEAKRRQPYCSVPGCTSLDLTVDHIDPASKGRRYLTLADVQVLCRSHNAAKGRKPVQALAAAVPGPAEANLSLRASGQTWVL
jgi:5-methylcytosine-specific restriction endonuclease McrA